MCFACNSFAYTNLTRYIYIHESWLCLLACSQVIESIAELKATDSVGFPTPAAAIAKTDDDGLGDGLDATLESYLTGDTDLQATTSESNVTQVTDAAQKEPEVSDSAVDQESMDMSDVETAGTSAVAHSDDDDDDALPAGLIRGEPVCGVNKHDDDVTVDEGN